jgi:hypothetical protein
MAYERVRLLCRIAIMGERSRSRIVRVSPVDLSRGHRAIPR